MIEDYGLAHSIALEAILSAARGLHMDVDELCEKAIESLLVILGSVSPAVAMAIDAIEKAADALDYGDPDSAGGSH